MSWKSEMYQVVKTISPIGGVFSLADAYKHTGHFKKLYPNNSHIEDKIRQTLQYLRDDGIIEFIQNSGEYKRLK